MTEICTWEFCTEKGIFIQATKNGKIWAHFCLEHDEKFRVGPRPMGVILEWTKAVAESGRPLKKLKKGWV